MPFERTHLSRSPSIAMASDKQPDPPFGDGTRRLGEIFSREHFQSFFAVRWNLAVSESNLREGLCGITIGQADEINGNCKVLPRKRLAFIKIENGEWKSPIVKFFF